MIDASFVMTIWHMLLPHCWRLSAHSRSPHLRLHGVCQARRPGPKPRGALACVEAQEPLQLPVSTGQRARLQGAAGCIGGTRTMRRQDGLKLALLTAVLLTAVLPFSMVQLNVRALLCVCHVMCAAQTLFPLCSTRRTLTRSSQTRTRKCRWSQTLLCLRRCSTGSVRALSPAQTSCPGSW